MFKGFLGLAFGIIAMETGYSGGYSFPENSKLKVEEIVSGISSPSEKTLKAFQEECQKEFKNARLLWRVPDTMADLLLFEEISYGKDVLSSVLKIVRKILKCEKIDPNEYKSALNDVVKIIEGGFFSGMSIYSQDLDDELKSRILDLRNSFWSLLLQSREIISTSMIQLSSKLEDTTVLQVLETVYPGLSREKRRLIRELFADLGKKEKAADLAMLTGEFYENDELY